MFSDFQDAASIMSWMDASWNSTQDDEKLSTPCALTSSKLFSLYTILIVLTFYLHNYRILRSWIMLVFHITYKSIWPSLSVLWCLIYIFKARTGESQLSCLSCIYRGFFFAFVTKFAKMRKMCIFLDLHQSYLWFKKFLIANDTG